MEHNNSLPKKYKPEEIELKWMEHWLEQKTFAFDPNDTTRPIFSIDTPPPTVSGKMHLGHAFGNSQQDFIARYKRLQGFNVLQPFGTDDNGLPTKLLVEKLKKVRASDMDRKEFRALVLKTLNEELKPAYLQDWKRLGISCDFDVKYSTINPHCQRISQKSFLDLHKIGREYRAEAPAMYCPKCQTAIAQVECEDEEKDSFFNDIVFKVEGQELIIATTRPELLPACVAVFYHPTDERYQQLKGKKAKVPLFDLEVPILEDERADPQKGTGIVMCCTFGDQTDMEWQKAHNLPIREAIGSHGRMTALAEKYEGKKIEEARKEIIADLDENELLKGQKPIKHAVNVHERCGTPVEFIHSKQWFVKYLDLKDKMMEWGNDFTWWPTHMKNRYDNWVNGLAWDWCISRQLPFGIPFPVWYCKECDTPVFAREEDLPVDPVVDKPPVQKCANCGAREFVPETDIINTWATSSLTPTIVKELFKGKPVYEQLVNNPMDLRPQGHDIITFWLFNTVIKSNLHFAMKPWKHAFINGWMLDPKGKKMSKSKGNVIEPQKIIREYSADALRFMAAGSKLGEDMGYPEKDVLTGKKTITKLFNAGKFVHMHLEDYNPQQFDEKLLTPVDKGLLSKLGAVITTATDFLEEFNFARAKAETDIFFWQDLCDNYLEVVKDRLYKPEIYGEESRLAAQMTLQYTLSAVLKLFAPYMPFITEEVYSWKFINDEQQKSIHTSSWPKPEFNFATEQEAWELAKTIIAFGRQEKNKNEVSQKHEFTAATYSGDKDLLTLVQKDIDMTLSVKASTIKSADEPAFEGTLAPKEEK